MNKKISKLIATVALSLSVIGLTENAVYAVTKERISVNDFEKLSVNEMYEYLNLSDETIQNFKDYHTDEEIKDILIGLYDVSPDRVISKEKTLPADGDKVNLREGFIGTDLGIVYCNDENLVKVNGWQQINGYWYHFNNYIMDDGWLNDNGVWYYLSNDLRIENGKGRMQTGWFNNKGTWYYFYSSGAMATNVTIGGHYVNSNGVWVK